MTTHQSILEIKDQLESVLLPLTNDQYSASLDVFNGSSVGKHVRHIIDFYVCIVNGCCSDCLDYNARERNETIENNKEAALGALSQVIECEELTDGDKMLEIVTDFSSEEGDIRPIVKSSVGRELMYAFDHAIHHLAIIKMGLRASFPSLHISNHIGVAPSTIKYHSKN